MKINNPERYCRKFREDFELVKRKLITNSYSLGTERNSLIDCLTQVQNFLEDEIQEIIKEREGIDKN